MPDTEDEKPAERRVLRLVDGIALLVIVVSAAILYRTSASRVPPALSSSPEVRATVPMLAGESDRRQVCRRYTIPDSLCDRSIEDGRNVDLLIRPRGDTGGGDAAKGERR